MKKVMYETGNAGPMVVKNKAEYISHDILRQAGRFNVSVKRGVPPAFSKPSVATQLALTAIGLHFPHRMEDAIHALFQAFWVDYKDTTKASLLTEILSHVFADRNTTRRIVNELSNSDAVKAQLTAANEAAVKDMAFGCPTFIATNAAGHKDVFWGFDHLGQVIDFLDVQRPSDRSWSTML